MISPNISSKGRLFPLLMSLFCVLMLLSAGCESGDGNSNGGSGRLAGTNWKVSGWSASSLDPSRFTITATFNDSQISGTSAVNSYSGTYTVTADGSFSIGALQSTLMAGSDDAMRAEQIYLELLGQSRKFTLDNTTLTLLDRGNNASLIFTKK